MSLEVKGVGLKMIRKEKSKKFFILMLPLEKHRSDWIRWVQIVDMKGMSTLKHEFASSCVTEQVTQSLLLLILHL